MTSMRRIKAAMGALFFVSFLLGEQKKWKKKKNIDIAISIRNPIRVTSYLWMDTN